MPTDLTFGGSLSKVQQLKVRSFSFMRGCLLMELKRKGKRGKGKDSS